MLVYNKKFLIHTYIHQYNEFSDEVLQRQRELRGSRSPGDAGDAQRVGIHCRWVRLLPLCNIVRHQGAR